MKSITIEELEKIDGATCCIVDIRPEEQYRRGTFPGAVNIPMEQFEARKAEIPKEKAVYLLCHTGERSQSYTEELDAEASGKKELIAQFRNTSSVIETNIFNSVKNINLRTVIGYHKDDMAYQFLDDYDDR